MEQNTGTGTADDQKSEVAEVADTGTGTADDQVAEVADSEAGEVPVDQDAGDQKPEVADTGTGTADDQVAEVAEVADSEAGKVLPVEQGAGSSVTHSDVESKYQSSEL